LSGVWEYAVNIWRIYTEM